MTIQNDRLTILIVDDVAINIQVLANCLSDDYHIKVANNGEQCLQLAQTSPLPDLILLNIEMPGMDGYEVCLNLKAIESTSDVPIIFVTAHDTEDDEEQGLALGAVDYLTKPIQPALVKARINAHMELKRQRDQLAKMTFNDELTELYNRHYLFETGNQHVSKALRHGHSLSLLIACLDHFETSDQVALKELLRSIAKLFSEITRNEDVVAYFEKCKFAILLDHCELLSAQKKAEHFRQKIARLEFRGKSITASFGLAELKPEGEHFNLLLKRVEMALYDAQNSGGNCVICSEI
ncbi:GGDEF domain-containing response regulator [Aliikangiella coralliicola]|uniref:Response regulator n=1 Tax=Aliikangiella coralliicola TaxID=2592383 RepID=A0A545UCL7_9GAMM|nr:response regulator [Aliikangiella coralliicola]TQV87207.1 response regulator [Aliikangiella coralliicola]